MLKNDQIQGIDFWGWKERRGDGTGRGHTNGFSYICNYLKNWKTGSKYDNIISL